MKNLEKLLFTILETTVEAIEKKHWTAFINNGFATISILSNLKELGKEIQEVRNNPEMLETLEKLAINKYSKHEKELVLKTFRKVYSAIVFNVGTAMDITQDWKK